MAFVGATGLRAARGGWSAARCARSAGAARIGGRRRARTRACCRGARAVRCAAESLGGTATSRDASRVTSCRARHVLVASEELARSIENMLAPESRGGEGKAFADIASVVSLCDSKQTGGELGWFRKGTMVPDFERACFEAQLGQVFVVKSPLGWHVAQVDEVSAEELSVSIEEFAKIYRAENDARREAIQFVDVREADELAQAQLDGFISVPTSEYPRWGPALENGTLLDMDKETLVLCKHGVRAAQMCVFFAQRGMRNVKYIQGGIDAYSKRIDATVPSY